MLRRTFVCSSLATIARVGIFSVLSLEAAREAASAAAPTPADTPSPSPSSSSIPSPTPSGTPLPKPVPGPSGTTIVFVPAGTAITVHVLGKVDSGSARDGDTFDIQASNDVVVSGFVVVPKGAQGQGSIVKSQGSGGNGKGGALTYQFDFIHSADGGKIKLSPTVQTKAEADRKGASSTATIIGIATFGLGGLFGHNLARGHQLTLDEKTPLTAFVADNVHVETAQSAPIDRYDK